MKTLIAVLIGIGILMATFSMFGTKTRVTVKGDEAGCRAYLGEVNRALYQMRQLNSGGFYALPTRHYQDGTTIKVWSAGGYDYAEVYKPMGGKEKRKFEKVEWHTFFCGQNDSSNHSDWRINKTKTNGETKWDEYVSEPYLWINPYKIASNGNYVCSVGYSQKYDPDTGDSVFYHWYVECRTASGEVKWTVKNDEGNSICVTMDSNLVYVVGGKFGVAAYGTPRYTRVEARKISDGSLVWQIDNENSGSFYQRGVDCAVDSKYLYVSDMSKFVASQAMQGRLLVLDKTDGSLSGSTVYVDTASPEPVQRTEIAVSVKDIAKSKPENVLLMTDRWIKTLDGSLSVSVNYEITAVDFNTIDKSIAGDETGIYTVGQLPKSGILYQGYQVCKFDYDGNNVWSTTYNEGAGYLSGPFLSDIAIDDKLAYVSGFNRTLSNSKSIRQALDKKTGEIVWTNLDTPTTYNYMWGVATGKTTSSFEVEE